MDIKITIIAIAVAIAALSGIEALSERAQSQRAHAELAVARHEVATLKLIVSLNRSHIDVLNRDLSAQHTILVTQ